MTNGEPADPKLKAAAIARAKEVGIAQAHAETGFAKSTLSGWLKAEGFDVSAELVDKTRAATQVSRANRAKIIEESQSRMTVLLATIAELAGKTEVEMLQSKSPSLSEVVGARTRAIHDLQLLLGNATSRGEITMTREQIRREAAELDELAARRAQRAVEG